ncbi:MAG: 4-hydroxy-tetrahydrodipicolinate synthase [Steroidobacteraceae bacterium]
MFSGSLVAIVTPMRPDGSLDFEAWSRLIDWHLANGTSGIVVGGTTGESPTLLDPELRELTLRAVERARGRAAVIVGAGTNSTASSVERARWLSALGVDALLVVTPAYNKPTQEGLYRHFEAVSQASEVPVVLYNVPGRTAVDMLPPTVVRLAALPRIGGLKEAVPEPARIRQVATACPAEFAVLSGDDLTAREAVTAGAAGVISVTANVAPRAMADMIAAVRAGDLTRAAEIDGRLAGLHRNLFVEANPIPVKWALAQMGMMPSGIRLPLTPLSANWHAAVTDALRDAGIELNS